MSNPKNKKANYTFVASPIFIKKVDKALEKIQKKSGISISRSVLIEIALEVLLETQNNINYDDLYNLPSLSEAIKEAIQEKEKTT